MKLKQLNKLFIGLHISAIILALLEIILNFRSGNTETAYAWGCCLTWIIIAYNYNRKNY